MLTYQSIIKLRCLCCGTTFDYRLNEKTENYRKCPHCENVINMRTESKIEGILDMEGFEIVEIQKNYRENVLSQDISQIKGIYDRASSPEKEKMFSIIDKLYLLINRKDEKTNQQILDSLNKILYEKEDINNG